MQVLPGHAVGTGHRAEARLDSLLLHKHSAVRMFQAQIHHTTALYAGKLLTLSYTDATPPPQPCLGAPPTGKHPPTSRYTAPTSAALSTRLCPAARRSPQRARIHAHTGPSRYAGPARVKNSTLGWMRPRKHLPVTASQPPTRLTCASSNSSHAAAAALHTNAK